MATYIGYYRPHPDFWSETGAAAREAGHLVANDAFREKVAGLRDKLPSGIKLIGSYVPIQSNALQGHPSVWICECDDAADLTFVNNYYAGFLTFEWVPATALGNVSSETESVIRANQSRGV